MTGKQAEKLFVRSCPTKKQCCNAKNYLRSIRAPASLCTAATRSLTELSAFLDVSSLNLAVLRHRHFFADPSDCDGSGFDWAGDLGGQRLDQQAHIALDFGESRGALEAGLIHIEVARDFYLQRVHVLARVAVMAGDEAAGVRIV